MTIVDFFFLLYFNRVLLSLNTIQHIESLSLLFNNNYYLSFIIIILKLSKDSLRGRSIVFFLFTFLLFSPSIFIFSFFTVPDDFSFVFSIYFYTLSLSLSVSVFPFSHFFLLVRYVVVVLILLICTLFLLNVFFF